MARLFHIAAVSVVVAALGACAAAAPAAVAPTAPAAATPAATVAATNAPEPTDVDVYAGDVIFGKTWDSKNLKIATPLSQFSTSVKAIAWVAHLSEPAGATTLTVLVLKASGGSEKIITSQSANVSPEWTVFGNRADIAGALGRAPGTYILRYVRGDTILAEGTFKLVKG